ncbi:hypothetical protein FQN60_015923 [Etheostoma spectabile]|uniref:Uncharacterized protein n=1 Tax=Etheostoma spectabile TaxID=54343 RepID=A0A5J5CNU0_9PERO|nr:hypothetical protein FQN60_015923 [Etheostoma spectabile]
MILKRDLNLLRKFYHSIIRSRFAVSPGLQTIVLPRAICSPTESKREPVWGPQAYRPRLTSLVWKIRRNFKFKRVAAPLDLVLPLMDEFELHGLLLLDSVLLTSEAVGHVGLEDDLAEDGGQRQGLVALVPQRDVTVASLQAVQRQDALANQLVVVVVDGNAQYCQIWISQFSCIMKVSDELTCTLQVAAMTPSTGVSEKGSNILSDRRMKSGFSRSERDNKTSSDETQISGLHMLRSQQTIWSNPFCLWSWGNSCFPTENTHCIDVCSPGILSINWRAASSEPTPSAEKQLHTTDGSAHLVSSA